MRVKPFFAFLIMSLSVSPALASDPKTDSAELAIQSLKAAAQYIEFGQSLLKQKNASEASVNFLENQLRKPHQKNMQAFWGNMAAQKAKHSRTDYKRYKDCYNAANALNESMLRSQRHLQGEKINSSFFEMTEFETLMASCKKSLGI